jgi:hypothetical protein
VFNIKDKNIEMKPLTTNKYSPNLIVNGSVDANGHAVKSLDVPFLIPIYQRLYTWETVHVHRLLEDLYDAAFSTSKSINREYFIGALVTTRELMSDTTEALELIDGQQRLTTLWLIASVLVMKSILSEKSIEQWQQFLKLAENPRLNFSGRDSDVQALNTFVKGMSDDFAKYGAESNQWLTNTAMANARNTVANFLSSESFESVDHLQLFSDYIWNKATFVITELHPLTDKERFFDTMNSRGVQLEKHEILKSLMLIDLTEVQRGAYGKAWDICADIDGYISGPLQVRFDYGVKPLDEAAILTLSSLPVVASGNVNNIDVAVELSLEEILAPIFKVEGQDDETKDIQRMHKSPVSFPVFLLHVLKLYTSDYSAEFSHEKSNESIPLDDKKLIEVFKTIFKDSNKQHRQRFIEYLLECRLLLDNFVIKGELDSDSEHVNWQISSRLADSKRETRLKRRGNAWASISMLQSMMHFSPMNGTQRVTWLNPFLKSLRAQRNNFHNSSKGVDQLLFALQQLDYDYANKNVIGDMAISESIGAGESKGLGTRVHHYWFYKLEYCLWELWYNEHKTNKELGCKKPKSLNKTAFRMRTISSVEHVSPQSQNNGEIDKAQLDRFGNLALISVSENSTYSDKDPIEKKGTFDVRLKKGLIQSLKLAHIFSTFGDQSQDWDNNAMQMHEKTMLAVLQYFHELMDQKNKVLEVQV